MAIPRHEHDCDACRFIGQIDQYDIWLCPSHGMLKNERFSSLIMRYGVMGDYMSMPDLGNDVLLSSSLRPAFLLAVHHGFIPGNEEMPLEEETISCDELIKLLQQGKQRITPLELNKLVDKLRPRGCEIRDQAYRALDSGSIEEAQELADQLTELWGVLDSDAAELRARIAWRI